MIGYLEGTVEHISGKTAIIAANGIGFPIILLPKILVSLTKNQGTVKIFVWSKLNMREGTFDHYGFTNMGDLELFRILTSVQGLGPKTAMQVLSTVEPKHLKEAVVNEDPDALRKISGLGTKTAHRLVVELQGKLDYIETTGSDVGALDREAQAIEALTSLGYSSSQAKDTIKSIKGATDVSDLVRKALQLLGKK
jgi:Holliday junction DNA helicase RuvA